MVMGNELERTWTGVIAGYDTVPAFTQCEWRSFRKAYQESRPRGRNAKRAPQAYRCTGLPLEPASGLVRLNVNEQLHDQAVVIPRKNPRFPLYSILASCRNSLPHN
jgi:hypothetical protein